ncbi:MAG: type III toxin-antitoxin system ToxN/AbiQ family toxin [Lachnospiraceae bacterium]|nr:type III toxin-antitoxin system ToxN/AbiQ family toxin [Lachnospiraceae bacterium]
MSELKIYSVSDEYIAYLRKEMPNVYSNKIENRAHTRKYVGVVIEISGYKYYIPMSSPKDTDYQIAGENRAIKKSIVPIIRMVVKNTAGEKELKGTLRISHMIPVPESELELYDLDNEPDVEYKDLVQNEIIFIRKNKEKIMANANLIYKQKKECDTTAGYVKSALDYMALEKLCDTYMMELQGEDNTINHSDL